MWPDTKCTLWKEVSTKLATKNKGCFNSAATVFDCVKESSRLATTPDFIFCHLLNESLSILILIHNFHCTSTYDKAPWFWPLFRLQREHSFNGRQQWKIVLATFSWLACGQWSFTRNFASKSGDFNTQQLQVKITSIFKSHRFHQLLRWEQQRSFQILETEQKVVDSFKTI